MKDNYLESVSKQFQYYKLLGEKTFDQLTDEDLFWVPNSYSNSIALIVKHVSGNMLSRWTDFLNSDGEKEWRNRDGEFLMDFSTRHEMMDKWNKGWDCLFAALDSCQSVELDHIVYIRNIGHTIVEAINRQLAHYAYHIGQVVYIGTLIKENDWKSLSIPKNQSQKYNASKFSKDKHRGHFTDDLLNSEK